MEIKVIPLGEIQSNCYLLSTQTAAIVIDPGFDSETVTDFLKQNTDKERLILLTHAHFDHIGGAANLRNDTNTKIGIGAMDNFALSDAVANVSQIFGCELPPFSADILFYDGQQLTVGDIDITIIHTPGHTPGGVCYLIGDILFSGDTLFCGSIGRTDFINGDFSAIVNSIKGLYQLDESVIVLSGHGPRTTIGNEKRHNSFVRG